MQWGRMWLWLPICLAPPTWKLVDGVVHLDPKSAVQEAMLAGWTRQQQTRFLNETRTIQPRVSLVRRLGRVL
jgi:hypothetical protein